ncbi:MAG: 3-hydroxyacyl-CoA dehydrogenase family protein [Deltaproteobacteria bacterium]|nr:3-hydroxyacyl-CoA dehydrogenase family protein [Deltaproteobacteria bacterium]MBW2333607.1 3-hydroxyacyl-CoA dehydrogenase family protein [Deltaproteobacteria bacterium]
MEINKVACVGAGLVGQGWATIFLSRGLEVIMQDISQEILNESMKHIRMNLKFLETHGLVQKGNVEAGRNSIKTTTDITDACGHADYVQESVPDTYEIKKRVFSEMDAAAPAHVILASSASGLLMTDIQEVTTRPERCVLVHPILPVHLIPTVEIAGGEKTSRTTVQEAREFMERIGKSPVVLRREVPGYIINRLQAALLREAIDLVDKGIASPEEVDKAFCRGTGLRDPVVGPFLRMHIAGNGIEDFIENFAQSYRYRWETMETWTSIPPSAIEAVVKGTRGMEIVCEKSLDEMRAWRDEMLANILKLMDSN